MKDMSALKRQELTIVLSDGGDGEQPPIELTLINPDFLRVERELPRLGLPVKPKAAPMSYMTAVGWAACKRLGLYDGQLRDFLNRDCLQVDFPKRDDDDEGSDDVPPTQRAVDTD